MAVVDFIDDYYSTSEVSSVADPLVGINSAHGLKSLLFAC